MVTSVIRISFLHIKIYEKISGECSHCCWINKLWTFDYWTTSESTSVVFFLHFAPSFTDKNLTQILHPLESLPDQTGQKKIDAATRKNTEFIWRLMNNKDKVSRLLKPTFNYLGRQSWIYEEREKSDKTGASLLFSLLSLPWR